MRGVDRWDWVALSGAGLVTFGLWQMSPPLAIAAVGVLLLLLAFWGASRWGS